MTDLEALKAKLLDRVSIVDGGYETPCWMFLGGWDANGCGVMWWKGKHNKASRLSYIVHKGPIPQGLFILHSCHNRYCCNPDHLRAGTQRENMIEMIAAGRAPYGLNKGERNGWATLKETDVIEIRRLLASGRYSQEAIGAMFNVGRGAIKAIHANKTWKHLSQPPTPVVKEQSFVRRF